MIEKRRACWGVLIRVTPTSPWCCYGPTTHREALAFRRLSVGTGIERQIVQLIPMPTAAPTEGDKNVD
jgi:hypothetical protein